MNESKLRAALRALADKMEERCGYGCSNSCFVCELRSDLRLILALPLTPTYPGQAYFHKHNPNIKRAEQEHGK